MPPKSLLKPPVKSSVKSSFKHPVGRRGPTPQRSARRAGATPEQGQEQALALPHERDESAHATAAEPDPLMLQAKRDIDAGQVDTDMRATPGLSAERRARLVPGPGGKPPASGR